MTEIIEFPDVKYLMCCRECKSNAFFVFLSSNNPHAIECLECAGCERMFLPTDSEISYSKSEDSG